MTLVRQPAVAGRFYAADPVALGDEVRQLISSAQAVSKSAAIACLVPHAGYVYSGGVAGAVYARLAIPNRVLILGPRHFPRGADLAINRSGVWQTPLGAAEIDAELGDLLAKAFPRLVDDVRAHQTEHSLEVQIPFLQMLAPGFRFVPIAIGTSDLATLEGLGNAIAEALVQIAEPVLMVASSDMNHYEEDGVTRAKDRRAIDRLLALDALGLYQTVRGEGITMCGYAAATAMLVAACQRGAKSAELVKYATSGDVFGDREEVVGYAGMVFG
ncbi:MAG TPA: AmmeMemoRadiSam system protein B [Candidatus Acidoferrales bacterium]|nr:AmmeMemoRadiSam system protein B [Candidatus Acidoferrales bacterium]